MHLKLAFWTGLAICLTACQATTPTRPAADVLDLPPINTVTLSDLLAPGETLEILTFPDVGAMTVAGVVESGLETAYVIAAAKGQPIRVALSSPDKDVYFNLIDSSTPGDAPVFAGEVSGREASLTAAEATTFLIRPRLSSVGAQGAAQFEITVSRAAPAGTAPQPSAPAAEQPLTAL